MTGIVKVVFLATTSFAVKLANTRDSSYQARIKCFNVYYFQATLGVSEANEALLYCIISPVGPYFKTGSFKPVSLMADPRFERSWHGGCGDNKAGGYA